jgi:hypothetical protein
MSLMTYLQPYISYMICAIVMCVIYIGVERANGPLGLTTKSILCSWSIISTGIIGALYFIQSQLTSFPPKPVDPATIGGTVVACILTLSISSCCINCAK